MDHRTIGGRHLICTVIAPNYLSQALTLGESIAREMPKADFRILVLQDCENVDFITRGIEKYSTTQHSGTHLAESIADIDWQDFDIPRAANQYTLLEFATCVKPALLRNYLNVGWQRVTYMDPDIEVYEDFEEILNDDFPMSVTPHVLADFPPDGRIPNHTAILNSGLFNLGFVSVRPQSLTFLNWWANKLMAYCTIDTANGLFVDQRWVDWSVTLSHPQIIRNPGLNVAYWNLHERRVQNSESGFQVSTTEDTFPLYFFHFSGFRVSAPSQLSKYTDRIDSEEAVPVGFMKAYAAQRITWEKIIQEPAWSIGGRMRGNALPLDWRREMISEGRREVEENKEMRILSGATSAEAELPLVPFRSSNCSIGDGCSQPLLRNSVESLAQWLQASRRNVSVLESHESKYSTEALAHFVHAVGTNSSRIAGIKLLGFFGSPTGTGRTSRNILQTLDAANVPVYAENITTSYDSQDLLESFNARVQPIIDYLPSAIAVVNADTWPFEVVYPKRVNVQNQNVAAVWAWELEHTPDHFHRPSENIDLVFAISPFSANAMSKDLNCEVKFLPAFGELPSRTVNEEVSPDFLEFCNARGIKSPYLLARFDAKSILKRKNPDAILDVWDQIQTDYPNVQLVVKTTQLSDYASIQLVERLKNTPRVLLIDEVISQTLNEELLGRATSYISLHRAEGLGLNVLEAITVDVPTIFTNYSGIASELSPMGFPVKFALVAVGNNAGPYHSEAFWAEPDSVDAELQTRRALDAVLSGSWIEGRDQRRLWVEEFYRASHDLTVKRVTDFLNLPMKNAGGSKGLAPRVRSYLTKISLLSFRRFWKILPLKHRSNFRPIAIRIYRRFF